MTKSINYCPKLSLHPIIMEDVKFFSWDDISIIVLDVSQVQV